MTLAILADDLTGACDAAAPFAARGLETVVLLESPRQGVDADVVAVDVDTRRLSRSTAVRRTIATTRSIRASGATTLYKKVDSTLRGHAAAEILACARAWPAELVVLCPAFPSMGRRVDRGRLVVDGRGDLGSVAGLAGFARSTRIATVDVDVLDAGAAAVGRMLEQSRRNRVEVVVVDATGVAHLDLLIRATSDMNPVLLLAGSAGLATALARRMGNGRSSASQSAPSFFTCPAAPWLVVAGSLTDVTAAQVLELERAGAEIISLDAHDLVTRREVGAQAVAQAARALAAGVRPVLRLEVDRAQGVPSVSETRVENRTVRALGRVVRAVVEQDGLGGLFLTGGLTARACLLALGARGLRLESEPLPGIAESRAVGGMWDGRLVITKAGGFGRPDAIRRLTL
jgi:D-threonate/D-erythronate kinase